MLVVRSLIYFLLLVLSVIAFSLPLAIIGWAMPFRRRSQIANAWGMTNLKLLSWICRLDYEIQGWENLPEKGFIVMAKHQSSWETIALRGLLPPEQAWVLKQELMRIPFFGWALAAVQSIAIDRKSGRNAVRQIIRQGKTMLDKGRVIVVFPEGTRVAPGEKGRYGVGGAMLAEHSGYPVVPIAHNAGVFWRRRGVRKYPGTIQVVIGPAIKTIGLKAAEINRLVESWIETTVESLPKRPY